MKPSSDIWISIKPLNIRSGYVYCDCDSLTYIRFLTLIPFSRFPPPLFQIQTLQLVPVLCLILSGKLMKWWWHCPRLSNFHTEWRTNFSRRICVVTSSIQSTSRGTKSSRWNLFAIFVTTHYRLWFTCCPLTATAKNQWPSSIDCAICFCSLNFRRTVCTEPIKIAQQTGICRHFGNDGEIFRLSIRLADSLFFCI